MEQVIDGKKIAQKILDNLKTKIQKLKIKPHLAIVLVGENSVWQTYVRQKEKKAQEIGAQTTRYQLPTTSTTQELTKIVNQLNRNSQIHGIIIQRPLPNHLDKKTIAKTIDPQKDVDGFHPESKFPQPVAEAVLRILNEAHRLSARSNLDEVGPRQARQGLTWLTWLKRQNTVVIGKGETAGQPITQALRKLGVNPQIIDSKTTSPDQTTRKADMIISCVGKPSILTPKMIKKGVILIGVGLHKDKEGKLSGDYEEEKIKKIASFYTPVPGGVGPVNVACLLENLANACYFINNPKKGYENS